MIKVIYDGNLGNNLFQYTLGRLIAERLNFYLESVPINGFPGTYEKVGLHRIISDNKIILRGQNPSLDFLDDPNTVNKTIILQGYFQNTTFYEQHREKIKDILRLSYEEVKEEMPINPNDVVIGMRRRRDYIPRHGLPTSYYENALDLIRYRNVYICTDAPNDPFVKTFAKRHNATIRHPHPLDNLKFITKFANIIISNSTFLWWGAFLSDANKIVFPRPQNGFWSEMDEVSRGIKLEVSDPSYIYLKADLYKSEFFTESLLNQVDRININARGIIRKYFPSFVLRPLPKRSEFLDS